MGGSCGQGQDELDANKESVDHGGSRIYRCNATHYFSSRNWHVTVLDNLSRDGTDRNLQWLRNRTTFDFEEVDVCDRSAVERIVSDGCYDAVIHLAAQVAVTTSVVNPRMDFMVNALGTFNVLDAVRLHSPEAVVIFASTNKVYGKVNSRGDRARRRSTRLQGPLVRDQRERVARTSSHPTAARRVQPTSTPLTSRGSTASPPRRSGSRASTARKQFGVEDQGWLAWFAIASLLGRDITIYGDGNQVRDVLHVDDLLRAYEAAIQAPDKIAGQAFNVGGGPDHILSLLDLVEILERRLERRILLKWQDWRPGDQRVYVSDIRSSMRCWAGGRDWRRGRGG